MGNKDTGRNRVCLRHGPVYTANSIRCPAPGKASRNTTHVVHRDDTSLMKSIRDSAVGEPNADPFNISWRGVDTAHNTLVIAFEEDANEGECLYGGVELLG